MQNIRRPGSKGGEASFPLNYDGHQHQHLRLRHLFNESRIAQAPSHIGAVRADRDITLAACERGLGQTAPHTDVLSRVKQRGTAKRAARCAQAVVRSQKDRAKSSPGPISPYSPKCR